MAYGAKKGVKAPGEFSPGDISKLAMSGALGIVAAIVTDYQQRGDASALYTINQWVVQMGRLIELGDVPLWSVMAGLVGLGALSTFYFQPTTRQGAFAQGYGLLAALMMATPPDFAGGIEAAAPGGFVEASVQGVAPAVFVADEARLQAAQDVKAVKYDVQLAVRFPNGLPGDLDAMIRRGTIRGRLHNEGTGESYNLFRNSGGDFGMQGDTLLVRAGVPADADAANLWVRIECLGYAIEEQSAEARLDERLDWRIEMRPSATPLFIQRLGKSYWF